MKSLKKSHFYESEDSLYVGNLSNMWKHTENNECLEFDFKREYEFDNYEFENKKNKSITDQDKRILVSKIMNEPVFKNRNYTKNVYNNTIQSYSEEYCDYFARIEFENMYEYTIRIPRYYIPISDSLTGNYGLSRAVPSKITSIIYLESISYIQAAVDAAIISLNTNSSISYDIDVGHLSKPPIDYIVSGDGKIKLYSLLLSFVYIIYVPIITHLIVEGKEKKIKNIMDLYDFQLSDYLLSWNLTYLIIAIIHSIIITCILFVTKFFEHVNPLLIFMIMVLYGMSICEMSLLFSHYLKNKDTSGYISFCIITIICCSYFTISYIKLIPKLIIVSFCSPITFGIIMEKLQHQERNYELWIYILILIGNIIHYHIMIKITSSISKIKRLRQSRFLIEEDQFFYYKQNIEKYTNFEHKCLLEITNISRVFKRKIIKEKIKPMTYPFLRKYKKKAFLALKHINFKVYENEIFMIVGPKGSGKSTLFNILIGLIQPSVGEIIYNGNKINKDHKINYQHIGNITFIFIYIINIINNIVLLT